MTNSIQLEIPNIEVWKKMIEGEEINHLPVREIIKESWKRSKEYGISPFCPDIEMRPTDELLNEKNQYRYFIETAKPFMEQLFEIVSGTGFVVMLCDREGFVIDLIGDSNVIQDAKNITLSCGIRWSEKTMGTSSIGVCLEKKIPVQICGTEHYLQLCHEWTCSAAPITNQEGQLIGVLNMSGNYKLVHKHTLGMVVAAARAISYNLRIQAAMKQIELNNEFLLELLETISEGLISVDQEGNLKQFNKTAQKLLQISSNEIGKQLVPELKEKFAIIKAIKEGFCFTDREITLDSNITLSTTLRPIREKENIVGALVTFQEIKSVRKMIHRIVGLKAHFTFKDILGNSFIIKQTIQLAQSASEHNTHILLLGESGTGKEVFAQAIHNMSKRKNGPFIAINCGAVPRELIGTELFGYAEGAFTGARRHGAPGKFELADGGTIFLDEIGDMPLEQQVILLRVLEEKHVTRVGGTQAMPINVNVISATNKDINREINEGQFRQDLFYRLNVISIKIPPLRERGDDIIILANHFLSNFNKQFSMNASFSLEAIYAISNYHWPGNVRELQNIIQQAMFMSKGTMIAPDHLNIPLSSTQFDQEAKILNLKDYEKDSIENALRLCNGKIEDAARMLGISRATLYRRLKNMNKISV